MLFLSDFSAYHSKHRRRNYVSKMATMAAIAMIAASLFGRAACAHPALLSTEPAAGATAETSTKLIKIAFTETVIPQFSGAEVRDQTGKTIATGKSAVDPANTKVLLVPVNEQLPPGEYTVEWHVVSSDTHRMKGNYTFSVGRR
jgi:methionine-rich copper-binding protein CopC